MTSNLHSQISDAAREAIDTVVLRDYRLEYDSSGHAFIDLFVDLNEPNDYLLQAAYDHRFDTKDELIAALKKAILTEYKDYIIAAEDDILMSAGFDPYAPLSGKGPVLRAYLRETFPIYPPYEEFLCQPMQVNIILATPAERAQYCGLIKSQYLAMTEPDKLASLHPQTIQDLLKKDSSLKRLVEQQGCTMSDLAGVMRDYVMDFHTHGGIPLKYLDARGKPFPLETRHDIFCAGRSAFLTSLCVELDNHFYTKGCITILAEMSMLDFAKIMASDSEITMPSDCHLGIYAPWGGHGSMLGIRLNKPLAFRREDILDVQVEGANPEFGHTVDTVYGPDHRSRRTPLSILEKSQARKPSLDSLIASGSQRTNHKEKPNGLSHETGDGRSKTHA